MIILDTNVVSEMWRPQPDRSLVAWLKAQSPLSLYICSPVLAELRFGAERLDASRRRDRLHASIDHLEHQGYRDRILFLDGAAASEFGRLAAKRERAGQRMGLMDGLIASIALTNNAGLATRDIDGFSGLDMELINPFEFAA